MHELTDERLASILRSVGEQLEVGGDEATIVHVERLRWHRHFLVRAAAVLLVVAAIALAVAPVRRTVATWFSIGDTEITRRIGDRSFDPSRLPGLVAGAELVPPRPAPRGVPLDVVDATPLGPIEAVAYPQEGGVVLLWSEGATTLWLRRPSIGADEMYEKLVDVGDDVQPVERLGDGALAVRGDHVLVTPARRLAARTVVLWTAGAREYRLESDLPLDEMTAIARAIDGAD